MYIKKILVIIAVLIALAMAYFGYFVYTAVFTPNTEFTENEASVFIPTEATYVDVRKQLEPLLIDMSTFDRVAERKLYNSNIKPGHFIIKKGMNNNDIVNTLRSTNVPVYVIFNNQERIENLAGRISEQIEADSIELLNAMKDTTFLQKHGFDEENSLSLFIPNKYEFYWNTSANDFVERMAKEYYRFWDNERVQKADKIGLSPQEVSVLASIVQKETAKVSERPRIAGVYMNRYKIGMKLDADPTVIFAVKKENNNFDTIIKRVLYKDLETDSPYNTYKYAGIPPGPIAMPDISSIDAVLNYENHKYLYFVSDVKNFGYHKFAENLRQHNNNKRSYIRWLQTNKINR